jgi:hypothetical protein
MVKPRNKWAKICLSSEELLKSIGEVALVSGVKAKLIRHHESIAHEAAPNVKEKR